MALAIERFGRVDQLVANAGFADRTGFGELTLEGLRRSERTILDAFLCLATAALPHVQASGWGRVVAVSSFVAHVLPPDQLFPASAAAKGGLEAAARALASHLATSGATVNVVAPGYTRKDSGAHAALGQAGWSAALTRIPLGRLAEPMDVAAAIAFFLSREARYITGQVLHVDGGLGLG